MKLDSAVAFANKLLLLIDRLEPLFPLDMRLVPERQGIAAPAKIVKGDGVAVLAFLFGLGVGRSRGARRLAGRRPVEECLGSYAVLGQVVLLVGRHHRQQLERDRPLVEPELRLGLADGLVAGEDKDVVEQVDLEVGALALGPTPALQLTLVDKLTGLVVEPELLTFGSSKLRVELDEVHPALRLAGGRVDFVEPAVEKLNHLRDPDEVRVALRRHLENCLEQKWVTAESGGRLSEKTVELDLARLRFALDLVDKADEIRVVQLLLLELMLAVSLVAAIVDERLEERDAVEEDVTDGLNNWL